MDERRSAIDIEEEAARWVWRLHSDGRTSAERGALDAWCAADPRHRGALLRAEAAWLMLDRAKQLPPPDARPAPVRRSWRRWAALAGAGALAASLAGTVFLIFPQTHYRTVIGEIRRVPLADGSAVEINGGSDLGFSATAQRRTATLSRGEAWFQVAKDKARPFVVEAGRVRVRAVGTAFAVRRRDDGADVLVTEGVVSAWADGGQRIRVRAGSRAFIAENGRTRARAAASPEIDRMLAWRDGRIDLGGETLAWAAAEFNRYNTRDTITVDAAIGGRQLYGVFRTDDPEGFAAAVGTSLGVRVTRRGDGAIAIAPPPPPPQRK